MENTGKGKNRFGLLGKDIAYSFSQSYFTKKFDVLGLTEYSYANFDLKNIKELPSLLALDLKGFNVTIPYKEAILPHLHQIDKVAAEIGAVNTVRLVDGKMIGYNTDAYGFEMAIKDFLTPQHTHALIFGTGGASKAIKFVLAQKNISFTHVSRSPSKEQYGYEDLTDTVLNENRLLINCTPVGTYPNVNARPALNYEAIGVEHLLFDLIYNPPKTAFLKAGEEQGATTVNGYKMLEYQAEKAWDIWTDSAV